MLQEHIDLLLHYYQPDVARLRQMLPDVDFSVWPNYEALTAV